MILKVLSFPKQSHKPISAKSGFISFSEKYLRQNKTPRQTNRDIRPLLKACLSSFPLRFLEFLFNPISLYFIELRIERNFAGKLRISAAFFPQANGANSDNLL